MYENMPPTLLMKKIMCSIMLSTFMKKFKPTNFYDKVSKLEEPLSRLEN